MLKKITQKNELLTLFACLFIFLFYFAAALAKGDSVPSAIQNLDKSIQQQIKDKKVIGCVVAIVDHGKVIFMKAYGVRKKGDKAPTNLDTVFQLGSISKPIAAALVAILIRENRLKLDSTVISLYPHILPETTVQHILSHTTGYDRKGWNQKIEAHQSRDLLLKQLAASKQAHPGDKFDYHNVAYSLIEEVITSALQQPFARALEVKLFQPLGMAQAKVGDLEFAKQSNYAWPHQKDKKGIIQACKSYSRHYHRSVCSAGGISANIKDMAAFLQLQLGGKPDILTSHDLLPFHSPVIEAPDAVSWLKPFIKGKFKSYYGLGWRVIDTEKGRIVFHGGWLKGFKSFLAFIPDHQIGIVILNNNENSFSVQTAMTFLDNMI